MESSCFPALDMKLDDSFHRNIKCTCTHIEGTLIESYISVTSLCLNEVVIGASVSEAPLVASTAILFLAYVVGARITRYVRTYVRTSAARASRALAHARPKMLQHFIYQRFRTQTTGTLRVHIT